MNAPTTMSTSTCYTDRMRVLLPLLIALSALLTGCAAEPAPPLPASHPRHLLNTFAAFSEQLQADPSAEKAQTFIDQFALTRPQMITLFGPEKGAAAWKGYHESILPAMRAEAGTVLLREVIENKRTDAWVETTGPAHPAATTRGDMQILDNLVEPRPIYTARFRRPGETLGVRMNGFVYIDGEWKALFKVHEHL